MRHRPLAAALAGSAAIALTLSGCFASGDEEPSGSSSESDGSASALTQLADYTLPDADAEGSLEIWSYEDPSEEWIQHLIQRFNDEYPNVTVNWTYIPFDQIVPNLLASASTGEVPDAIFYAPQYASRLADAGLLADITGYWDQFEDADTINDGAIWHIGDGISAVQGYANTAGMIYNKDILAEAGITDIPTALDDFSEDLSTIASTTDYDAFAMGATNDATTETQVMPYFLGYGENYGTMTEETATTVFGAMQSWVEEGALSPDATGWGINDGVTNFLSGNVAFALAGPWNMPDVEASGIDFAVAPMPGGPDGQATFAGGEGFSIMSDAAEPGYAFELFRLGLLTADAQQQVFEEHNQIPSRTDLADADWLNENPNISAYVDIISRVQQRPPDPEMDAIIDKFSTICNSLVGGQLDADSATQQLMDLQDELTVE